MQQNYDRIYENNNKIEEENDNKIKEGNNNEIEKRNSNEIEDENNNEIEEINSNEIEEGNNNEIEDKNNRMNTAIFELELLLEKHTKIKKCINKWCFHRQTVDSEFCSNHRINNVLAIQRKEFATIRKKLRREIADKKREISLIEGQIKAQTELEEELNDINIELNEVRKKYQLQFGDKK